MEAATRVPPGFWPFADKSDIRPAERSAESSPDFVGHETRSIRRFSSAVEQRFCKPKVGSSILSTGTTRCPQGPKRHAPRHIDTKYIKDLVQVFRVHACWCDF